MREKKLRSQLKSNQFPLKTVILAPIFVPIISVARTLRTSKLISAFLIIIWALIPKLNLVLFGWITLLYPIVLIRYLNNDKDEIDSHISEISTITNLSNIKALGSAEKHYKKDEISISDIEEIVESFDLVLVTKNRFLYVEKSVNYKYSFLPLFIEYQLEELDLTVKDQRKIKDIENLEVQEISRFPSLKLEHQDQDYFITDISRTFATILDEKYRVENQDGYQNLNEAEDEAKFTEAVGSKLDKLKTFIETEDELGILNNRIYNELKSQGLRDYEFFLCKNRSTYYLLKPRDTGLFLFKINLTTLEVNKKRKITYKGTKLDYSYRKVKIDSKNYSGSFKFSKGSEKTSFKSRINENLEESDLIQYGDKIRDKQTVKEMKEAKIGLDNNFQSMSPYEFEEFIADLFQEKGFNAYTTSKSGDYGIDVVAEGGEKRIGIQAKRHKETNKVGAPTVQKVMGSRYKAEADRTILVTTSYFTEPAKEQASNGPIDLWNKRKLRKEVEDEFIDL